MSRCAFGRWAAACSSPSRRCLPTNTNASHDAAAVRAAFDDGAQLAHLPGMISMVMVIMTVILRLHQVGRCRRSNRTRRRRVGWNRECAEREQDGSGETIGEFLHEVSLQVAPIASVASRGEYEMNDTIVQSCIAPISRPICRASERFVGIHAPQSGLPHVACGSLERNTTRRARGEWERMPCPPTKGARLRPIRRSPCRPSALRGS